MIDQQPDIVEFQEHLQEDVTAEDILDDVLGGGDFIDDLHGLKGIVSAALGRLGFKFSFVIVLLFNFVYTVHNAFATNTKSEISVISFNNCSCDSRDRLFYSAITYGFIGLWVAFLLLCALYSICNFIHELCSTNDINDTNSSSSNEEVSRGKEIIPENHHWFLKRELFKLTAMVFYLNKQNLHNKEISSTDEITLAVNYLLAHMKHKFLKVADPRAPENKFYFVTDNVCKISKYVLVVLQFFLRLPVVPLLLLQWLDEYSWNCVIGSLKSYCKDTVVGYIFDQSMVISCLYICILLAIIIVICMQNMPINRLSSHKKSICYQRKWCLLFEVNHTVFLTNVSFIMIIALIYTSVLSQFTYVAITEAEKDVNSDKTFNIDDKWLNRSISGGVSNSVLWKCIEKSSSPYLKTIFLTLLIVLIATAIFYAIMSLVMAFVNYQRVKILINYYYGDKMCSNSMQHNIESMQKDSSKSIMMIVMILHKLFQLRYLEIPQNETEYILTNSWREVNVSKSNSYRWKGVLFLIPTIELILILLLFLLVLTSYNVHPIGCFFIDVHYDEVTNMVTLELMQGVHIYQQVAVVTAIVVFFSLIFIKSFHIYHVLASNQHQLYLRQHNIVDYHDDDHDL